MINQVIKETLLESSEVVFAGSPEECIIIEKTLQEYHRYDACISIRIKKEVVPEYKTLEEFMSVYEYRSTYEEIQKEK